MTRLLLALVLALSGLSLMGAPAAAATTRSITVSGTGVGMYPEFEQSVERYGVTTTAGTAGTVRVTATTSDPSGTVLVNGTPADGTTTVSGLEEGDEISVVFEDSAGRSVHSLVHLPAQFPELEVTVDRPGTAPGEVAITLSQWNDNDDHFEVLLDRNAVPTYVKRVPGNSMDLRRQDNGTLTVSRVTTTEGRTGHALHVLGDDMATVSVHETVGLKDTDGHDSIVLPDGGMVLLSYEYDPATELTDSVIQELDASGDVVFEWNSVDHLDIAAESTSGTSTAGPWKGDYAHVNSVQVLPDGHFLASFRHTSSVMKIARFDDQGFSAGEVMWRLGGKVSDFTFPDDPHAGPCAQHTAYMGDNGNIVIFDNGSWEVNDNELCVNPADPTGPSIARPFTRITEYAVDESAMTARLVWSYDRTMRDTLGNPTKLFAIFAGSSQRLPNDHTLIGWASEKRALVTEVDDAGRTVWEVRDPNPDMDQRFFTYRAFKIYGPETFQPDGFVRADGSRWVGRDVYGGWGEQRVVTKLSPRNRTEVARVRLQNDGNVTDRFRVKAHDRNAGFKVRYVYKGRNVTDRVVAGKWRTPTLDPGQKVTMKMRVTRTKRADRGDKRRFVVRTSSVADRTTDKVAVIAKARR